MRLEELAAKVRTLEDIEGIRKLQFRYTYFLDTSQWDDVVNLFAENAKAQISDLPLCEGKEEIAKVFKQLFGSGMATMTRHMVIQPVVEVEGDRAKGTFYLFACATFKLPQGPTAAWSQGKYENEYVREKGEWKISSLKIKMTFRTPYADGWVKTPMMDMGAEWRRWQEQKDT